MAKKTIGELNFRIGGSYDNRAIEMAMSGMDELARKQYLQDIEDKQRAYEAGERTKQRLENERAALKQIADMDAQQAEFKRKTAEKSNAALAQRGLGAGGDFSPLQKSLQRDMEFEKWYTAELAAEKAKRIAADEAWLKQELDNEEKRNDAIRLRQWLKDKASGPSQEEAAREEARRADLSRRNMATQDAQLQAELARETEAKRSKTEIVIATVRTQQALKAMENEDRFNAEMEAKRIKTEVTIATVRAQQALKGVENKDAEIAAADRQGRIERARLRDQEVQEEISARKKIEAADREHYANLKKNQQQAIQDRIQTARNRPLEGFEERRSTTKAIIQSEKDMRARAMWDEEVSRANFNKRLELAEKFGSKQAMAFHVQRFGSTAADNNMRNTGFRTAMISQQLGFGIQDFMSQVTNSKTVVDGLGRGVMAVSNNVQMLGSAFGPTGLAVTAIGGALAGIILPAAFKWLNVAQDIEIHHTNIYDSLKRQFDLQERIRGMQTETADEFIKGARASYDKAEQAKRELDFIQKQIDLQAAGKIRLSPEDSAKLASQSQAAMARRMDALKEIDAYETQINQRRAGEVLIRNRDAWQYDPARLAYNQREREKDLMEEMYKGMRTERDGLMTQEERINQQYKERLEIIRKMDLTEENKNKLRKDAGALRDYLLDPIVEERLRARKEYELSKRIEDLNKMGVTPASSSPMSVAGSAAAASAINRALSGSRSEESDRKKQIKIAEDQLKELRDANKRKQLGLADIPQA